jgi:hypothetical protein
LVLLVNIDIINAGRDLKQGPQRKEPGVRGETQAIKEVLHQPFVISWKTN